MDHETDEITALLCAWRSGAADAERRLLDRLYPMVRVLAARQLGRVAGPITLRATELANEAFLKLYAQRQSQWENRKHFLAVAGRLVRRVVLDHLKARERHKRGAGVVHVTLDRGLDESGTAQDVADWITIDQLLQELESVDEPAARLIELRYFAGLTIEEAADVTGMSVSTAVRNWRSARAWLHARLS